MNLDGHYNENHLSYDTRREMKSRLVVTLNKIYFYNVFSSELEIRQPLFLFK